METLQFLIKKIIIAIPVIFLMGLIYFVFVKYVPDFSFGKSDGKISDILPAPQLVPEVKGFILDYKGEEINGTIVGINQNLTPGVSYMTVDKKGNLIYYKLNSGVKPPAPIAFEMPKIKKDYDDNDYVRNLSIFTNGHIYTNLTFTGEAKNTMFKDNLMQLLVVDNYGKIISVENVIGSKNWAPTGWTRFNAKLNGGFPVGVPCSLVFRPAGGAPDSYNNIYVQIPERCN